MPDSTSPLEERPAPFPSRPPQPFDRYVHEPITARDVLVFRIMREVMHPTKFKARILDRPVENIQTFTQVRAQDTGLGADLHVLRKMLVTNMAGQELDEYSNVVWDRSCTLGEQIEDLVQRHYLESRDYTFRAWLEAVRPPRHLIDMPKARVDQKYRQWLMEEQWVQGKVLDAWHLARARRLQRATQASQSNRRLYDGGAIVALLRRSLDSYLIYQAKPRYRIEERMRDKPVIPVSPEFKDLRLHFMVRPSRPRHPGVYNAAFFYRDTAAAAQADAERGRAATRTTSRRRTASEPDVTAFVAADLLGHFRNFHYQIVFPRAPLRYVVRLSRSRSASPTRLADMFVTGCRRSAMCSAGGREGDGSQDAASPPLPTSSDGRAGEPSSTPAPERRQAEQGYSMREAGDATTAAPSSPAPAVGLTPAMRFCVGCCMYHAFPSGSPSYPPCDNCAQTTHRTSDCRSRCGFCGAPNPQLQRSAAPSALAELDRHTNPHAAARCPVAKANRCKCVAFPQFHAADECPIPCSRDCGNPAPPGSWRHRNAMTCRSRCCMCGIRGSHSGKECRLRTCRCKGKHLGQDCGWNPTCRVPGCDRFLCGLHCRGCGSAEKPFIDRRCRRCAPKAKVG